MESRSLGQRLSLFKLLAPADSAPLAPSTVPISTHRAGPHLTKRPSACPAPLSSPGSGGQWVQEEHPLCLLSATWEEDEIRRDRVEPQSVSLSWREPVPAGAPGGNGTEYEIRYYEKVSLGWKPSGSGPACLPQSYSSVIPNTAAAS